MLTWKPKCGKNHGSPQTVEYTMGEEYNNENTQRQRPLVLFLATRGGSYTVEATTSLSFSLYLSHALYNYFYTNATTHTRYVP